MDEVLFLKINSEDEDFSISFLNKVLFVISKILCFNLLSFVFR